MGKCIVHHTPPKQYNLYKINYMLGIVWNNFCKSSNLWQYWGKINLNQWKGKISMKVTTWAHSPGPTEWKGRTEIPTSCSLNSTLACGTHTHAQIYKENISKVKWCVSIRKDLNACSRIWMSSHSEKRATLSVTAKNADCQRGSWVSSSGTSLLWRPTPLPPPTFSPTSLTTPLQSFVPSDRSAGKEGVLESWCHDVPYGLVCLNAWSPGSNPVWASGLAGRLRPLGAAPVSVSLPWSVSMWPTGAAHSCCQGLLPSCLPHPKETCSPLNCYSQVLGHTMRNITSMPAPFASVWSRYGEVIRDSCRTSLGSVPLWTPLRSEFFSVSLPGACGW